MRDWRGMLLSPCAVLLTVAGCSKPPEPTAPVPAPVTESASAGAPVDAPVAAESPAESGLAIKRGVATLSADRNTFRPCGESGELLMVDQTKRYQNRHQG